MSFQLLLGLFLLRHLQFFPPFLGWVSLLSEGLDERLVSVGRLWLSSLGYCIFFLEPVVRLFSTVDYNCNMTLEELVACDNAAQK